MKIPNIAQIRLADAATIEQEPISSSDLMERAAGAMANWFAQTFTLPARVVVFCGSGNNGGDGLCLARLLFLRGYEVSVCVIKPQSATASPDFLRNEQRLHRLPIPLHYPQTLAELPPFAAKSLIIDALFGSGLNRPVGGFAAEVIQYINANKWRAVVAVDIPSGLFADVPSPADAPVIRASHTLSFQFPKLAFLFAENYTFVAQWKAISIGLLPQFTAQIQTQNHYFTPQMAAALLKPPNKFAHKGSKGHALVIGGMYGKMGACILCAKATLKAGAGLLSVFTPQKGYNILQTAFPEAMVIPAEDENALEHLPNDLLHDPNGKPKYAAIAIGPGMGVSESRVGALSAFLQNAKQPLVIDADALNLISAGNLLHLVPRNSILTPHPKEFERMAGKTVNAFTRLETQRKLSMQYGIFTVLKGAHTCIACPDGVCYFNSSGNPAMATAGSGDVLTGFICGLLAQGYSPQESALLGVYLHGLAGDRAATQLGTITAADLVSHFSFSVSDKLPALRRQTTL